MLLMHKDISVAKIEFYDNKPYNILELYNPEELPFGLRKEKERASKDIMFWHAKRAIPIGRVNLKEIEDVLGSREELAMKNLGLSLTDSYWYKEENSNLTWEDINLFEHGFSPDLLLLKQNLLDHQTLGPDYTTNGCLEKFWIYKDNEAFLIKAGSLTKKEPILAANEVVAYRVANRMGLAAVPYKKAKIEQESFCICPAFIKSDQEEFVSLYQLEMQLETNGDNFLVRKYLKEQGYGLYLDQLATFTILIHNYDCHFDNAGFIIDSNTKEILRPCPLFDNGSSLNASKASVALSNMRPFENDLREYAKTIQTIIPLPKVDDIEQIIKEVYEDFELSSSDIQRAVTEIRSCYKIVQNRQLEIHKGIDFSIEEFDIESEREDDMEIERGD